MSSLIELGYFSILQFITFLSLSARLPSPSSNLIPLPLYVPDLLKGNACMSMKDILMAVSGVRPTAIHMGYSAYKLAHEVLLRTRDFRDRTRYRKIAKKISSIRIHSPKARSKLLVPKFIHTTSSCSNK